MLSTKAMQDTFNPVANQEQFVRDLIGAYKNYPVLWDKNHPHYRSRAERTDAQEALAEVCREYYPEADEDFVKVKIDSLRSCFRKEWNKVRSSKASAQRPEDIHKPNLWYFNLLLFTVGENTSENTESADVTRSFWPREYSTMLIGLLKRHPCLYVAHPIQSLAKRNNALKKITQEMNDFTGKKLTVEQIRKKIQLLKGQYRVECKKIRNSRKTNPKRPYRSHLWCFKMLSFLKGHVFQKKAVLRDNTVDKNTDQSDTSSESDMEEKHQDIKEEIDSEDESTDPVSLNVPPFTNYDYDDVFDTIGKNVAHKLRDMTDDQRKFAEKLLNDVMYHGLMEDLTLESKLTLNGT